MDLFGGLNFWPVLVGTAWSMLLGFLWYGPLFGKAWMKEVGLKSEDVKSSDALKGFGISAVTAFIAVWTLAWIMLRLGYANAWKGFMFGVCVSVGFIAMTIISNAAYEKQSLKLVCIQSGYRVVFLAVSGLILGIW